MNEICERIRKSVGEKKDESFVRFVEENAANCRLRFVLHNYQKGFSALNESLEKRIKELQESCDCPSVDRVPFFEKLSFSGDKVFIGFFCRTCGKFFPRKKGTVFEVCHSCGADMKFKGEEKKNNKAGVPIILSHVYVCPLCKRTEEEVIGVYTENL